jgi:hypothetical protein
MHLAKDSLGIPNKLFGVPHSDFAPHRLEEKEIGVGLMFRCPTIKTDLSVASEHVVKGAELAETRLFDGGYGARGH